jgi:hypothetical protein
MEDGAEVTAPSSIFHPRVPVFSPLAVLAILAQIRCPEMKMCHVAHGARSMCHVAHFAMGWWKTYSICTPRRVISSSN